MPFVLLIMEQPGRRQSWSPDEARTAYDRMMGFREELKTRGVWAASESLKPDSEGVRVQARAGRPIVIEGPFAESKEMVGGFFLLDCATKDEAIAIAARCPATEWGVVEVREVGPCLPGAETPR